MWKILSLLGMKRGGAVAFELRPELLVVLDILRMQSSSPKAVVVLVHCLEKGRDENGQLLSKWPTQRRIHILLIMQENKGKDGMMVRCFFEKRGEKTRTFHLHPLRRPRCLGRQVRLLELWSHLCTAGRLG